MNTAYIAGAIAVMAFVTYLIRMLPLVLFQKKITNPFLRSFLYYVPYAVLSAMVLPSLFTATSSVWSAWAGLFTAAAAAFLGRSMLTVALCGVVSVFLVERLLGFPF